MEQSKTPATVGRILHAYSNKWKGPRAAVVCNAGEGWRSVNVFLDRANDRDLLYRMSQCPTGNSFTSLPLYDALKPEERERTLAECPGSKLEGVAGFGQVKVIAEWPPR